MDASTWPNTMAELKEMGVNYIAPPMWMLVTLENGEIVPSELTKQAQEADLGIITWTLERSGPLATGGGWYFSSITDTIDRDGDYFELLDVLAQDVKVAGVFSDWPATVTYYANCMGL
jgi:glycerophosphoryl diester phosphodiesterase